MKTVKNRLLIKEQSYTPERSKGGLIIPATVQSLKHFIGEVIAVGPEVKSVVQGDTVTFHPQAGEMLEHKGEALRVLTEMDVLAIL